MNRIVTTPGDQPDFDGHRSTDAPPSLVCGHAECVTGLPCKREAPDYWARAGAAGFRQLQQRDANNNDNIGE